MISYFAKPMGLMNIRPIKTKIFKEGENLIRFIADRIWRLNEGSILVVTSKIVSLAERRTAVITNAKTKEKLIRKESEFAIPTKYGWLTIKDDAAMPSAGIDESNAKGKLILLPKDSFKTARFLRNGLKKKYGIKFFGVLVTDSRTMPFRAGITGVALGYAGFHGVKNYRGKPDIFGRKFKFSKTNVADCLATAAVLTMGEGDERQPLAIIEKAPVEFCNAVRRKESSIDIQDDMYLPLFLKLLKRAKRRR